jgi:glucose-1-phosphate cytidylyltransferase
MKTIILAGGFGTRISEHTSIIPKPMITINNKPILWHVMKIYAQQSFNNFHIALGYKADVIKEYFLNYRTLNSDFKINLENGDTEIIKPDILNWKITLIDTGLNTMTGGRLKRLKNLINDDQFFLTYGDGVSNINIKKLLEFHNSHGKMITLTAVRPSARFGELKLNENAVVEFEEKPQLQDGWINGGFFVINREFFDLIENDETLLEREPLEKAVKLNQLMAYKHEGFWQCMDTKRDHEYLEKVSIDGNAPWLNIK